MSGDGSPLEDASWFYRLLPLASYRELLATKDEPVMRAGSFGEGGNEAGEFAGARDPSPSVFRLGEGGGFKAEGGLKLSLASGSYVMADVMASAVVRGRRCYAQTAMLLFGDSMGARGPETNSGVPPWPSFDFVGSGDLYWPQTGNAFTLTARGWSPSGPVLAWGDGGPAAGEYAVAENGVSFTPAHDPELSAESSAASKPIFMVAGTTDGGSLCYTFYVHRSRYAGADLHLGVTVAFSAFLLAGLGIAAFRAAGRLPRHAAQAV